MIYIVDKAGTVVRSATAVFDRASLRAAGYTVVESELNLALDSVEAKGFPAKTVIAEKRPVLLPRIVLTTTAKDTDGDGVPEIPADGKSKRNLSVCLRDSKGALIKKSVEVNLQTTAGTISQRKVATKDGMATVQLTASQETVTAVVYACADGFAPACLTFECVPKQRPND